MDKKGSPSISQARMLGQIAAQEKKVLKFEREVNRHQSDERHDAADAAKSDADASAQELICLLERADTEEGMNTPDFPLVQRLSKKYRLGRRMY